VPEHELEIPMQQGSSDSVFYCPEGDGKWPGVLYLTDIGGIRAANREAAARLSKEGYAVLMPNIFYRTGRAPLQPSIRTLDDEGRKKRMAELSGPLAPELQERDASIYIDFLLSQNCARPGMIGVVGHCFSGKMAMFAAAARPDKVVVAASFHGGGLYTDAPTSPHLALPRIKARLYFGHATKDHSMPEEAIAKLDEALKRWGGKYESEVYNDAYHSWTSSDSPVYNQPQAERAFRKLLELLDETLRAPNR
jgi:carboxymethylenebutenolidase